MKSLRIILGLALLGSILLSCAPPRPSPSEILDSLETKINEKDIEGVVALFDEDAVVEESFKGFISDGIVQIERMFKNYLYTTFTSEFRDISVDGSTATFTWAEVGPAYTKLWPVLIEVKNGKIIYLDFYEDAKTVLAGDE